jgi:hypothetical protein
MPEFEDYHRTVIGYHGTKKSIALKLVQGIESIQPSENGDDWLGHGIYFWEYAPKQAKAWAQLRKQKNKWPEEVAVVASMIRLGNCWDFLEPQHLEELHKNYVDYRRMMDFACLSVKANIYSHKYLDCSVFEYAYKEFENRPDPIVVDTCRAVFIPLSKKQPRLWPGSGLYWNSHIQLCVRNPKCILGTWLVDV